MFPVCSYGAALQRRNIMVYRKGELSKQAIDRDWPHQVALPASLVAGRNHAIIHVFCRDEVLSLCQRHHSFRRHDVDYVVYCFSTREDAERFQARFGGEFMDPASRPRGPAISRRMDAQAEARHRNGRCTNCAD
jgi:hypothetical protein